jgi:serine/threonine-protein kinase
MSTNGEPAAFRPDSPQEAEASTLVTPTPADDEITRISPVTGPTPAPRHHTGGLGLPGKHDAPEPKPIEMPSIPEAQPITQTLPGAGNANAPAVRQVGRYLIQERLGRGGMATVFKAHDPGIGRDGSIKFLNPTLWADALYRGRFLRQARAAGGLSHPNIVTVHDVGEIEGRPYMAMELLHGEPLSDLMAANKPMPVRDVVIMGIQLARALDYAHAHGIVHRDIKPGNIVRLKGTNTIKVTDFGIAHMDAGGTGEQRTRIGDVLGTPQYMSPEQTQGNKLDGRSDLFSVGIVLYQMLSGQRPFQGDSLVSLAMKIANDEPVPLEKLRPDLPHALRRIVERCLAKAPDRRFQTGRELSDALARLLNELDEAERNREKPRIVPLRVKWAATMAFIVAVVMGICATVITQRQYDAMLDQVTNYGASLARFIAAQNAVAALSEEWPTVEVAVQEMMKTGDFRSITVIDRDNTVRAASDAALVGKAYSPRAENALGTRRGGVTVWRYAMQGEPVLGFETPITFQGKPVGLVALGLAERPLVHVARLSMGLMAALVVVTVLAVAIAMYFVANWFARPIKVVIDAMEEVARGHVEHRIEEPRKDEFGLLFSAFDGMAQALQDARAGAGMGLNTPSPRTRVPPASEPIPPTA